MTLHQLLLEHGLVVLTEDEHDNLTDARRYSYGRSRRRPESNWGTLELLARALDASK